MNGLNLNIDKTNIIKFSSKQFQDKTFLINYQNSSIKESTNTIFLGLELDKHVNCKNHFNKILPKLSSAFFVVRSVYFYCNVSTLRIILFSYSHAAVEHGVFWGNLIYRKRSSYSRKG